MNDRAGEKKTTIFLLPDFGFSVVTNLQSVWLRAATCTVEQLEATKRLEESEEKQI